MAKSSSTKTPRQKCRPAKTQKKPKTTAGQPVSPPPAAAENRLAAIRAAVAKAASSPGPQSRTYFLLFSSYEPRGRRFVRLKSPSVLAWFQQAWRAVQKERDEAVGLAGLRGSVYGLDSLFDKVIEKNLKCPSTEAELVPLLQEHIYYERDIEVEPHFVHVETDDDEVNIEYFFFDDEFLRTPDALDRLPSLNYSTEIDHQIEDDEVEEDDDDDDYAVFIRSLAEE